jgi:tetratricopeptide (TPR) repeat protein
MKPLSFFLLFSVAALLSPAPTSAQSPSAHRSSTSPSDAVVSVQELAIPAKAVCAFEKGTSLLLRGDAEASLPYFATVIELAPSSYRAHHNLGLAHYHLGQLDAAAQDFQSSIDLTSGSFAPSLFGLSMIFCQRSQFPDAESLIRKGLFLNPGSAIGKYCLGLVQYSLGQIPQALQSALDARARDPDLADVHVLLARIHERQHNPSAVVADVQAYLKLDPRGSLQDEARKLLARAQQSLSPLSASLN